MAQKITNDPIEELKAANLELKFMDIKKDVKILDEKISQGLTTINTSIKELSVHVKQTNGSVARVQDQANKTDYLVGEHSVDIEKLKKEAETFKEETRSIRYLFKHPRWIYVAVILFLYTLSLEEIRSLLSDLLKEVF